MSRRRKIADISFDGVASNTDINNNNNNDNDNTKETSILDDLGREPKDKTHVFKGFYIENELAVLIDRITANKGKGAKSDLINRILRNAFKQEGLL